MRDMTSVREAGSKLYVSFEGSIKPLPRMESKGVEPTVVADQLINVWSHQPGCGQCLSDQYPMVTCPTGRTAHQSPGGSSRTDLILRDDGKRSNYSATVGCNQLAVGYRPHGTSLSFVQWWHNRATC